MIACAPATRPTAIGARAELPVFAAGAVWVPNGGDGTVSVVDARSGGLRRTLAIADPTAYQYGGCVFGGGFQISEHNFPIGYFGARACEIPTAAASAAGSVWVARNDVAGLERLDARTGASTGLFTIDAQPWAMTASGDAIFMTDYFGTQVLRFDARMATVTWRQRRVPVGPTGVAVMGGALYVVSSSAAAVTRLDAVTGDVVLSRPLGIRPLPIAVSGDAVWVRDEGDGTLRELDPSDLGERASVRVGSFFGRDGLDAIAFDGEGVWACSLGLRRVNARSARVDRELEINCVAATYGYGALWVLDLTGRLVRVAL